MSLNLSGSANPYAVSVPVTPTDGQVIAWSATLGQWTPVNATGAQRLAAATNVTGTLTNVAGVAGGGIGTATAIAGTSISVASSNGLPVVLKYSATYQQTALGDGDFILGPYETTSTPTSLQGTFARLPNIIANPQGYQTVYGEFDIGVVSSTRTFQLYTYLWTPSGSVPFVQILNGSNNPTYLKAIAGL